MGKLSSWRGAQMSSEATDGVDPSESFRARLRVLQG